MMVLASLAKWLSVRYELSGCGFKSRYSHLGLENFDICVCVVLTAISKIFFLERTLGTGLNVSAARFEISSSVFFVVK